jgi:hypothetical protein
MTVAVKIIVEPLTYVDGSRASAVLVEVSGKKKTKIKEFTKDDNEWVGHIWKGRDLLIEEVNYPAPKPKNEE